MTSLEEIEIAGGYSVIYVDPPWNYANRGVNGAAEKHYRTMSVQSVIDLPVSRIAAPDSVLFLWVTWPFLHDAFCVLTEWGFDYKTLAFLWVKHRESGKRHFGGGFWTRANTEPCLLAVRGKPPRRVCASVRQLIETGPDEILDAPLGKHSAKPPEARERIVKLMGDLPRVELFARERSPGWDAWGDQVPGGSDVKMEETR